MNILITGGTGFIGSGLCPFLLRRGHYLKVVTRSPEKHRDEQAENKQFISLNTDLTGPVEWAGAVINLAGENIFGQRWSEEVKQEIYSSRIEVTKSLVESIINSDNPPEVMISGSAVGYYGDRGSNRVNENNTSGSDFLAGVCADWEKAAGPAQDAGVRLVISRTGIVLEKGGGVLKQMLPAFKFFAGGPIGSGEQFIPWIHRYELCRAFNFFLKNEDVKGPFNVCAPNPVTMNEFTQSLAEVLNRPALLRVPEWTLRMALGEAADPVLESIRAQPEALRQTEFQFKYRFLREALSEIL